jgi:hypothetical protein
MVYACHAAALVHLKMGWQHHEVSPNPVPKSQNKPNAQKPINPTTKVDSHAERFTELEINPKGREVELKLRYAFVCAGGGG